MEKHKHLLTEKVEKVIARKLPDKFAVVFDGSNVTFSPFLDETSQSVSKQFLHLAENLKHNIINVVRTSDIMSCGAYCSPI